MEDDDEFGDLYTDVLTAFPCSSSSSQPPPAIESKTNPPQFQHHDDADAPRVFNLEADEAPNSNFGVEDDLNASFDDLGSEPVIPVPMPIPIPGLDSHSAPPAPTLVNQIQNENDDDDWDSDSEDDLQIVLNDNNHGPIGMGPLAMSDDEDEDGEPLIIVADAPPPPPPPPSQLDDQDWADDAAAALPADAKDPSDALKPNAPPLPSASKVSYPNYNHAYHPFHSQFKYVRPGATPLPGGLSVASGAALSQVRPQGPMPARARPDWRPPNIKPPHKGFHPPFWPTNMPARGLEFTLPSHKTIFDVDIDSFEEKPWKYPGVDVSDFFNFGLNEDSWKEYCKQLEQLRLESTMQSKIRVYESGRAEQEYDPDMPPELAAAAGIHDSSAENTDIAKADAAVADLDKGSLRVRPPLPTGRPIQVETGCGERLPSVDTRPPRLRDSDAVIEIVLQCSLDDVSVEKGANEHSDNDSAKEDNKVDVDGEDTLDGDEYFDGSQGYGAVKEDATGKRSPIVSSCNNDTQVTQVEERDRSPQRTSSGYHSDSRGDSSTENIGSPYEKRWTKEMTDERSPHMSSGESVLDGRSHDHHQQEDSTESVDDKNSPVLPSPNLIENAQKPSLERNVTQEKDIPVDKKPVKVKEDDNAVVSANTSMDEHSRQFTEHQKPSSQVEPPADKEVEDGGDFKASRSSDNSKATGSSRDHHKWREGVDEEEVQNGHSTYIEELKRRRGVGRHDSHRKDRDGRMEVERNYVSSKGKDEYYPYRDWDPYAASHVHIKSEGIDRRKERDYSEVSGQWRDEDARNRRGRTEDVRKQDSADEMISRHRGKTRDIDRSEKDDYLHSRKLLDSGSWRGYHDKDVGLRYKEKDNSLKRHKVLDDHHSKRRKEEHVRRDHNEKEDMLFAHRESGTRRKRERDDISNQRKRDDQPRVRDNMDDHHSIRYVDEVWVQRERAEQQRERDEWYRSKLSYEENLSRREREDGRSPNRSSRNVEEKTWVGHSRGKGEYKVHDKDKKRHSDPLDRMDWVEDDTSLQHKGADDGFACGVQFSKEGKRSRQERSNARSDHLVHAKDKQRLHEKKHKDNVRKARESEGTSGPSRRHQGGKDLANETADKVVKNECAGAERDTLLYATGESKDDVLSDDEQQQHGSKRGRSKLERWTSHKERDYATSSKLPSSSKIKEISKDKTAGCEPSSGVEGGSVKKVVDMDKNWSLGGGGSEGKDVEAKSMPTVDSHLDTVEKLKWRSERFKLPLTNEKDAMAAKKMESEGQPPQSETPANSQVKQERPARKRRWISS